MNRPYVEHLHVRNFGCLKDVEVELTQLHAFIGPNDSGKSTLLRALRWLWYRPSDAAVRDAEITARTSANAVVKSTDTYNWNPSLGGSLRGGGAPFGPVRSLRLDPDMMRAPSRLIKHSDPIALGERGEGLPAVYDALLSRHLEHFIAISERFVELFPTAKSIQLTNTSDDRKALSIKLVDGTNVEANELSEGMLYWLAFASIPYLERTPLVVIEEPENGLHPARIREVMASLRELSATTQIILATHSPLVINELRPEEVTLLTRPGIEGTVATPLTATRNFAQRAKLYQPGELWLNYADGELESDLVGPDEPAAIAQ
ncbi:MAG TPA: ATP-binding protein [Kofleriaceae bacterium]